MGIKEKVEAARKALGYGVKVFDEERYVEVYKRVYLCSAECGGIGCHVDTTIRIYRSNGAIVVYVDGFTAKQLTRQAEEAESEEEATCFLCMKGYAENLEGLIYDLL